MLQETYSNLGIQERKTRLVRSCWVAEIKSDLKKAPEGVTDQLFSKLKSERHHTKLGSKK